MKFIGLPAKIYGFFYVMTYFLLLYALESYAIFCYFFLKCMLFYVTQCINKINKPNVNDLYLTLGWDRGRGTATPWESIVLTFFL